MSSDDITVTILGLILVIAIICIFFGGILIVCCYYICCTEYGIRTMCRKEENIDKREEFEHEQENEV